MDRGKVLLPNRMDSENDIIEEVTNWEPITTDNGNGNLTSEENTSEVDNSGQVHLSHAGEVDVWNCPGVKVKTMPSVSNT